SSWPRGQAELFDPGAVMLFESLRLARRAIETAGVSAITIAAIAMLAGVFPLGALLAGLDRRGPLSVAFLADRAWRLAGTLALLFVVAALAQALGGAVVVLLGGKLIGALSLSPPADDLAFAALAAVTLALVLGVGVLRDLASASAVRAGLGFYGAALR